MRKKKKPKKWMKQWFYVKTYNKFGIFGRRTFYIFASTHETAVRKLRVAYPSAEPLVIAPLFDDHDL